MLLAWLWKASGNADIEHKLLQKLRRLSMLKEVKKVLKNMYFLEFLGFAEISRPPPYSPPLKLFPNLGLAMGCPCCQLTDPAWFASTNLGQAIAWPCWAMTR